METLLAFFKSGIHWYILKGGLLFFALSIPVLFLCFYFNLFVRKNPFINKLTKVYYIYMPLVFLLFGICWGAINGTKKEFTQVVENNRENITNYSTYYAKGLKESLVKYSLINITDFSIHGLKNSTIEYIRTHPYSDQFQLVTKNPRLQKLYNSFLGEVLSNYIKYKLNSYADMAPKVALKTMTTDIVQLASDGFVADLANSQIETYTLKYKKMALLIALFFLSMPIIETILYKILEKRKGIKAKNSTAKQG